MRLRWLRNLTIDLETSFLIGLVRSSIFWGMVAALVCHYGLGIEFAAMRVATTTLDGPLEWFYAFNFIALLLSPLLVVGRAATAWIQTSILKWRQSSLPRSVVWGLQGDFANPFRGWRALYTHGVLKGRAHADTGIRGVYSMFTTTLHFAWTLAMWLFFIGGFALVASQ